MCSWVVHNYVGGKYKKLNLLKEIETQLPE